MPLINRVGGGSVELQTKKVAPTTTEKTYTPDDGYDGFSQFTVEAMDVAKMQSNKTVTPTTSQQSITPDSGYDGLSKVTVNAIQTQEKSVNPTTSEQTVTPDSGKYLTKVTVEALRLQTQRGTSLSTEHEYTPDDGYDGLAKVVISPWGRTYASDLREFSSASKGEITGISFPGVVKEPRYVVMIIGDRMLPSDMSNNYSGDACISSIIYDKSKAIPYFMSSDMSESSCGSVGYTIFDDSSMHSSHFTTYSDGVSSLEFEYDSENQTLTFTKKSGSPYLLPGQIFVIVVY